MKENLPDTTGVGQLEASVTAIESVLSRESAALMATAGSEQKAVMQGLMQRHEGMVTARDMYNDFLSVQGEDAAWPEIGHRVPYEWVEAGFKNLGIVAYQQTEGKRGYLVDAFELNARGRQLGVPVAGLMLELSERYPEVALIDLFGKARQNDKSGAFAAEARVSALYLLSESDEPLSTTELSKLVFKDQQPGLDKITRLSKAIEELEKTGVIIVERFERGKTEVKYKLGEKSEPVEFKAQRQGQTSIPNIAFTVAKELIAQNGEVTRTEIVGQVLKRLPVEEVEQRGEDKIAFLVRKGLERLAQRGGLVNATDFRNEERSRIVLNPEYKDLVRDLKYISDIIVSGSEEQLTELLQLGQLYMDELLEDQSRLNVLLQKGKDSSSGYHQMSPSAVVRLVSSAIAPGESKNISELVDAFESQGKPYTRNSIQNLAHRRPEVFARMGLTVIKNAHNQLTISHRDTPMALSS